jgi:hypothetical protein
LASRYDVAASGDTAPAEAMESLSSWRASQHTMSSSTVAGAGGASGEADGTARSVTVILTVSWVSAAAARNRSRRAGSGVAGGGGDCAVHEVPRQDERVPQRAQGPGRDDLFDRDQDPAGRERGRGVHPAGTVDLDVAVLVGPLRVHQEHVQVEAGGVARVGVAGRSAAHGWLAVQQVGPGRPGERHRGQVLLGRFQPRGERERRPFVDRHPVFFDGPAEQRGQPEDVQAGEAEDDPADRPGAEQDLQRDAAASAHVRQVARPAGGQRVQRGEREPGQQSPADTDPAAVRHGGHELVEGHEGSSGRVTHVSSFQQKSDSAD